MYVFGSRLALVFEGEDSKDIKVYFQGSKENRALLLRTLNSVGHTLPLAFLSFKAMRKTEPKTTYSIGKRSQVIVAKVGEHKSFYLGNGNEAELEKQWKQYNVWKLEHTGPNSYAQYLESHHEKLTAERVADTFTLYEIRHSDTRAKIKVTVKVASPYIAALRNHIDTLLKYAVSTRGAANSLR